jgi:hypothetical protein
MIDSSQDSGTGFLGSTLKPLLHEATVAEFFAKEKALFRPAGSRGCSPPGVAICANP